MYVSRPVRQMCADPFEGEPVTLLIEASAAVETVERRLDALDGVSVTGSRPLDTFEVRTNQERIAAICDLDGIAAVETDAAVAPSLDGAGEDVDY